MNEFPPYELAVIFDVLHGRRQQFLERAPMCGRPTAPRHTLTEVPATENGRSQQRVPLKCIVQPLCVHLALRTLWHENWRCATKSTCVTVHGRKGVEDGALRGCQQRHHVDKSRHTFDWREHERIWVGFAKHRVIDTKNQELESLYSPHEKSNDLHLSKTEISSQNAELRS